MVDLPIDSMVIFHSYVNVYQRVCILQPEKMICRVVTNSKGI